MPVFPRAVVLFAILALGRPAEAVLIELNDPSLPASPDGFNLTRDTTTDFEWLDVAVTNGIDFDAIRMNELAPGGTLDGFRHASELELTGWTPAGQIDSLFLNFGFTSTFSFIGGYPLVRDFLGLLGCIGSCGSYGYIMGIHVETADPTDPGWAMIQAFPSQGADFGRLDVADEDILVSRPINGSTSISGHFLIRPVPEPSTGLLVAAGTAALLLRRPGGSS